jgi:hypothetical protein
MFSNTVQRVISRHLEGIGQASEDAANVESKDTAETHISTLSFFLPLDKSMQTHLSSRCPAAERVTEDAFPCIG